MRFDRATREKIHDAEKRGASVTIRWPTGAGQPEKDRVYRVQALEEVEKAANRLKEHPETCRDALAEMHFRQHGRYPEGYEPPKPKLRRPRKEDTAIRVVQVAILDRGWEAVVEVVEDVDPVRHTGVKARVRREGDSLATVQGDHTETEPEQIVPRLSRRERFEQEEADRKAREIEHKVSVDNAELAAVEREVADQRRRGKSGTLAERALDRARRRVALAADESA